MEAAEQPVVKKDNLMMITEYLEMIQQEQNLTTDEYFDRLQEEQKKIFLLDEDLQAMKMHCHPPTEILTTSKLDKDRIRNLFKGTSISAIHRTAISDAILKIKEENNVGDGQCSKIESGPQTLDFHESAWPSRHTIDSITYLPKEEWPPLATSIAPVRGSFVLPSLILRKDVEDKSVFSAEELNVKAIGNYLHNEQANFQVEICVHLIYNKYRKFNDIFIFQSKWKLQKNPVGRRLEECNPVFEVELHTNYC